MARLSAVELAYNYLKNKKGDASFEEIWNTISPEIHGDNDHKNEIIAELYSDLVLDNRFALTSEGTWGIRDYLKFEDVKKQYDFIDKFETTEEFDDLDENDIFLDDDDTNESLSRVKRNLDSDFDDEDDEDKEDDDDIDGIDEDDYDDGDDE